MKWLKLLGATVVSVCAFAGPALAGQGFMVVFDSAQSQFPTTTIGNIDYKDWYQDDISAGKTVPGSSTALRLYTERCAAFFGCGSHRGDHSLAGDGILWSLMVGSSAAVNFCISNNYPISATCGVEGGGSRLIYANWIAGCYVPGGGYTCTVTSMGPRGSQIAIFYTLGLPSSKMRK